METLKNNKKERAQRLIATFEMTNCCITQKASETKKIRKRTHIPFEEKCTLYRVRRRNCNRKTPCNYCLEQNTAHQCILKKDKVTLKCRRCQGSNLSCNRARPCITCQKAGTTCTYYDQDSLVRRSYNLRKQIDESEDECNRCIEFKCTCNGGQLC
jgi:hypothetical protein